jgi:hypothetical protein
MSTLTALVVDGDVEREGVNDGGDVSVRRGEVGDGAAWRILTPWPPAG